MPDMMPPSLSGTPPMGASPVSVPSGSPGSSAGASAKVREAINILQGALPEFSPGSDPHSKILSAIQSISKVIPPSADVPGIQNNAIRDLAAQAQKMAPLKAMMSSMGGQGAGAPGAAAPPAMGA